MRKEKNILVTGGAGFTGANFIFRALEHTGWRIVNLDALTYAGMRAISRSSRTIIRRNIASSMET